MTTATRAREHVPEYIRGGDWLLPGNASKDISTLRRPGETGNHVIHRLLDGRTVEEHRRPGETTNEVFGRLLRGAASKVEQ